MNAVFTQAHFNAHIRPISNRLTALFLPLLACALFAGLALGPAETARAQATEPTEAEAALEAAASAPTNALGIRSASWRAHFGGQAAEMLRGQDSKARQVAMRDVIAVANTGQRGIDLSAVVIPLLEVVQEAPSEERRIMALQALGAIGPEHSSELLYGQAIGQLRSSLQTEPSDRVRRVGYTLIAEYHAEKNR